MFIFRLIMSLALSWYVQRLLLHIASQIRLRPHTVVRPGLHSLRCLSIWRHHIGAGRLRPWPCRCIGHIVWLHGEIAVNPAHIVELLLFLNDARRNDRDGTGVRSCT